MKKKACIVDIKKNPEKIFKTTIYRLFVICHHPVTYFTRNASDTSWLLIYFTIL